MNSLELFDRATAFIIGDQMTKFTQNIPSDFDHVFVADWYAEVSVYRFGSVCLEIFVVCHKLHHTIPHFRADMVPGGGNKL
jgi:hypothetical protein